jgi:hypothetical protein
VVVVVLVGTVVLGVAMESAHFFPDLASSGDI